MRKSIQLPGLQPNSEYIIQIRGVDAEGNSGKWSSQLKFDALVDLIAPSPVADLTVDVDGPDFVINWTAPTTNEDGSELEDLRDYKIEVTSGPDTRTFFTVDEGYLLSFSLNRNNFVTPRASIDVTVYARDRVGNLSDPRTESAANPVPTDPVLAVAAKRNGVELMWTDAFSGDGKRYEIWKNGFLYAEVSAGTHIWTDTDVGEGPQEYFIRAVDLFDQTADSNVQIEGEITLDFETDDIPPKPPTNLGFIDDVTGDTGLVTLSWDAPVEDTDDTAYTDQEGFEVRYRFATDRPWTYVRVPDLRQDGSTPQTVELDISGAPSGVTMFWEVRAFDRSLNYSTWAITSDAIAPDTTPPDAPTGLDMSGGLRTIIAGWDSNTEDDLAGYRLYADTDPGVTIDPANLKFEGFGTSASWSAADNETWYAIVVAFDHAGNVSDPSTEQSASSMTTIVDDDPPTNVSGLTLSKQFYNHGTTEFARITATWSPATDESGIFGYVLAWQRLEEGVLDPDAWTEEIIHDRTRYILSSIDVVDEVEGVGEEESAFQPAEYAFRLKAIDNFNNRSADWSAVETITIDKDGQAPEGEVVREVSVAERGAVQSENFVNLLRGYRLSEDALEIYGSVDHDVSILLGRGGEGLNLSTINDQMWFGSEQFDFATWRVGEGGDMRVGGPGAFGERMLTVAEHLLASEGDGSYLAFYQTGSTPAAQQPGDLWANDDVLFRWDGDSWVDLEAPVRHFRLQQLVLHILNGEGSLSFTIGDTQPPTPDQHDIWFDSPNLEYFDGEEWQDVLSPGGSLFFAASGDMWSGGDDFFTAPWSLSRHGRAVIRNLRIDPDESMPDGSDLLYVSTDTDAPLLVIHKHDAANWDFRIAMDTFIDAGGHLQLAGGDLSLTSGNITLDGGVFEMSSGELNLTGTPVTLDGSNFNIKSGNIVLEGDAASTEPTGAIHSENYSFSERTGWALDSGNLYLFSGEIDASLITVQNQQNLLEYGYTTIPYRPTWYAVHLQTSGLVASITGLWSRYGPNGLRLFGDNGGTVEMYEEIGGVPDYAKVRVNPGDRYIYSAYVYNNAAVDKDVQLFIVQESADTINSPVFTVPPGEFSRVHHVFEIEPGNFGAYIAIRLISNGCDFIVDGLQFEQRTNSDEPSEFNIGGSTRIDADAIQTGSIVSNNYVEGMSGFRIAMDGSVEFQGGIFRGQLFAEDFVSGTIDNQNLVLSLIERFVPDHDFQNEWADTEILARSLA